MCDDAIKGEGERERNEVILITTTTTTDAPKRLEKVLVQPMSCNTPPSTRLEPPIEKLSTRAEKTNKVMKWQLIIAVKKGEGEGMKKYKKKKDIT